MAPRNSSHPGTLRASRASVWIDANQAVIIRSSAGRPSGVEVLIRLPAETEARFDARTADEVLDAEQVMVAGAVERQTGFDRAYVALSHRPDRLVEAAPLDPTR